MSSLYIPHLGDKIVLSAPWSFQLFHEYRNDSLVDALNIEYRAGKSSKVVLDIGTTLQIDRIYIRKGQSEYDSITFVIVGSPSPALLTKSKGGTAPKLVRFWVDLDDANRIEFERE